MSGLRAHCTAGLLLSTVLLGCNDEGASVAPRARNTEAQRPAFTAGNAESKLLARATFSDPKDRVFKVKRMTGDWHVEVKSMPALDVAVQSIVFQPGTQSGWHSHPGPVFIMVKSGEMTFYESDDPTCTPIRRKQGEGFLDVGDHAHIARNESGAVAENIVTYLAPPGAAVRIDEPSPGNCPFEATRFPP